ncbi:hypothetical protein A4X13_0g4607 [Tilletia indica]|uniref:Uncharacterized protein n=1 Tax=Tilletia indica TaxID=43049 RepID=A0A177T7U2_9BASI|nr:hypothetical protein A4X13_0g4607 [Tilletia indica]
MAEQGSSSNSIISSSDELTPVLVAPAASTRFPSLVAHLMPFHIDYDGPAPINSFLVFDVEQSSESHQPILTSAFRGRKLFGYPLRLPLGWSAAVVLKPTPAEKETAYARKQRALAQSRNAEERERRKTERLEVKRAEQEEKRALVKKERLSAREARQAEKAAEREEKRLARIAAKAASSSKNANGEHDPNAADAVPEEDEEDEDEDDTLDDVRFYDGAIDDSADEYNPVGMTVDGAVGIDEDEEEQGRVKKKARPRPRPRADGPRSALSTGGLSASLSGENPHGLQPPPPPYQSLSAISRFQQAVVATAQPSFSMDDDDEEDDNQYAGDAYATQDPTALDPAVDSNDMILPSDHQRERGDILDHNIVAIHATVDVEMDALAIAAARAAQTAAALEEQRAGSPSAQYDDEQAEDEGLPPAENSSAAPDELPGTPGEDDGDDAGTASTSAFFGRGGGSLVGGGLFDSLRGRKPVSNREQATAGPSTSKAGSSSTAKAGRSSIAIPVPSSSSTSPFAGLTTRSSPRKPSVSESKPASPDSVRSSSRLQGRKSEDGDTETALKQEATKRGSRLGKQPGTAVAAEASAVIIPGSDDEDGGATGLPVKSLLEADEEVVEEPADENQSPSRRSSRLQSQESPTKSDSKTTKKAKDAVVYGTGEAAAAARRAREMELSRRKSGRSAALPKRFKDDEVELPSSSSSSKMSRTSSSSKGSTLKRAASSGSLASKAASQGASAMRQWLSGAAAKVGGSKKGSSPFKRGAAGGRREVDEEEDEEEEEDELDDDSKTSRSAAKRRASSASLRRPAARKSQRRGDDEEEEKEGGGESGSEWEKESPLQRSKRLSAAPLEVVVRTSNRTSLEKETKAGGWRRSESASPRKASSSALASASKTTTVKAPAALPRLRQRIVTAVTSSGRVAVRPARFSPEPVPGSRKISKRTAALRREEEEEDDEDDDASSDDDDEDDAREDGDSDGGGGVGTKKKYRKRVWTKRWTFEERMDVMLGESHVPVTSQQARQSRGHNNSDVVDGLVKMRVVGRLSTVDPHPAAGTTTTRSSLEMEKEAQVAKAVGTSGVMLWNADGELDEGDDAVVRTVHELLGVWALVHEY